MRYAHATALSQVTNEMTRRAEYDFGAVEFVYSKLEELTNFQLWAILDSLRYSTVETLRNVLFMVHVVNEILITWQDISK